MAKKTKQIVIRPGSKQEVAVKLLKRKDGATIEQLSKAVKQPHVTVRSLIGVLRAKGLRIESRGDGRFGL
jgi:hypothetical protein